MGRKRDDESDSAEPKRNYIHISADEELAQALKDAAERAHRPVAHQARYLLSIALGLIQPEEHKQLKHGGHGHPDRKTHRNPS